MDDDKKINVEKEKKYIEKTLGISVKYHHWKGELELPYYITERYEMRLVELDTIRCIFLWPRQKLNQIGSLKKQIRRIQMEKSDDQIDENLPVVFVMDSMDLYHRTAFIRGHIPFIVPEYQLYLPFMGTYLQEKYTAEIRCSGALQPSTQLLLFYWYYHRKNYEDGIYMNDMVKLLGCSAMTVTRAFRQLEATGFFETGKTGVQKYLKLSEGSAISKENLFDDILLELKEQLISPVAETIYVDRSVIEKLENSESAVSILPGKDETAAYPCYAMYKKTCPLTGSRELLDASTQAEVRLWKYDPQILAENDCADSLSNALASSRPLADFLNNAKND